MWKGVNYADVCKIEKDQLEAKFTEDVRQEMLEKIKRRQQFKGAIGDQGKLYQMKSSGL